MQDITLKLIEEPGIRRALTSKCGDPSRVHFYPVHRRRPAGRSLDRTGLELQFNCCRRSVFQLNYSADQVKVFSLQVVEIRTRRAPLSDFHSFYGKAYETENQAKNSDGTCTN